MVVMLSSAVLQMDQELQDSRHHQMGMADTSPHLLLGPGPLSHAVSAAMHAVPSGNVYWGDAVAQQLPAASGMSPHPDSHQHEAAMQQHLAGVQPFSIFCIRILSNTACLSTMTLYTSHYT